MPPHKVTITPAIGTVFTHYFSDIASHWVFKSIGALILSAFYFVFPENSAASVQLTILFALIMIDTGTGIAASLREGQGIQSRKLLSLAIKVVIYFTILASAHLADKALIMPINLGGFLNSWLVLVELISILENANRFGIPLPTVLIDFLKGKVRLMEKKLK